jgi:histidine triad (HIT) family protein
VADCVFCDIAAGRAGACLVLDEEETVAFLDRRPLFPGHVLVVPRAHHATLADLPAARVGPLFADVQRVAVAVTAAMDADGTFVAMNNVVSQSVPHLHVHVVPRRRGDGLRGFFWPRSRYADDEEMAEVATRIAAAVPPRGASGAGRPVRGP